MAAQDFSALQVAALDRLQPLNADAKPIESSEFQQRIAAVQELLQGCGAKAIYLHAGTNLYYFTGLRWRPSERMVAAVIPAEGELFYVAPRFEKSTLTDGWLIEGELLTWEEEECPYRVVQQGLQSRGIRKGRFLLDEAAPYFVVKGLMDACREYEIDAAQPLTRQLRSRKSAAELALIRQAHHMTMEVIRATATILEPGIMTTEVLRFIDQAHRRVGAGAGSYFGIVLFGVATSFPHGVKHAQQLASPDWVLIDTGCELEGYISDITRSFPFGQPNDKHRFAWDAERRAQQAAFDAASLGEPCEVVDAAARASLENDGYGPGYELPGLPHRTGHGCGLDIHEWPNFVKGEKTPLDVGMVISNEPMLVLPDQFGVRLEDHLFMTVDGPAWMTEPGRSIEDPL